MSDLFLQAKNFSTSRDMPKVNVNDAIYVDRFELDSYGHWQFLGDTPLVDRVNARMMTQKTEATVTPVFKTDGVELTSATNSGLISDFIDGVNSYTQISVLKTNTTALTMAQGTVNTAQISSNSGVYLSSGSAHFHFKPQPTSTPPVIPLGDGEISSNDFVLIAVSVNKQSRTFIGYLLNQGVESDVQRSTSFEYLNNNNNVGLGNTYYLSGNSGKLTVLETVIFDKALNLDQIKFAANRIKTRINNTLGITI